MPHSLRAVTNNVHQNCDFSRFISHSHSARVNDVICVVIFALPLYFSQISQVLFQKFPRQHKKSKA